MSDEIPSDKNLSDAMLQVVSYEILCLYQAVAEQIDGFDPKHGAAADLINTRSSILDILGSRILRNDGDEFKRTLLRIYPSVIESLESVARKRESVSSQLRSALNNEFEDFPAYLAHWTSTISPYLRLLEETYDRIQSAMGHDDHQSLNNLIGAQDQISVAVYLDTDNVDCQAKIITAVERFVYALGYGWDGDTQTETGSIFKTWWGKILKGLTSSDVQERLARVEAYAETYLGERISVINSTEAATLKEVVAAIADIPNASIRVGSVLIVKYTGRNGVVLLSRPLSVLEIRILERYPEIQRDPLKVLELLGNALSMDYDDEEPYDGQDAPPEIGA